MNRPGTLSLLLLFVFSAYAWPQTEVATVFGTLTDASGAVIPGVKVRILSQSTGLQRDSDGLRQPSERECARKPTRSSARHAGTRQ